MARRHKIAIEIQNACNLIPVANELVAAIAEVRAEGNINPREDEAVKLLASKVASLTNQDRICTDLLEFSRCYSVCEAKAA